MNVDPFDRNAFDSRVFQLPGRVFESLADVIHRDFEPVVATRKI